MNLGSFDLMIVLPAFLAGLLVLATHIPLGAQVLKRGIVFIDLAIAQIAALGVIIAGSGELVPHGWAVQVPFTVGGDDKAKDLFSLFDVTLPRLLEAAK